MVVLVLMSASLRRINARRQRTPPPLQTGSRAVTTLTDGSDNPYAVSAGPATPRRRPAPARRPATARPATGGGWPARSDRHHAERAGDHAQADPGDGVVLVDEQCGDHQADAQVEDRRHREHRHHPLLDARQPRLGLGVAGPWRRRGVDQVPGPARGGGGRGSSAGSTGSRRSGPSVSSRTDSSSRWATYSRSRASPLTSADGPGADPLGDALRRVDRDAVGEVGLRALAPRDRGRRTRCRGRAPRRSRTRSPPAAAPRPAPASDGSPAATPTAGRRGRRGRTRPGSPTARPARRRWRRTT